MRCCPWLWALVVCSAYWSEASAQEAPDVHLVERAGDLDESDAEVASRSRESIVRDTRAVTTVAAAELAEAAPRSTPEALMALPGVSVQKTNHAGGSAFIRGTTGQQTLLLIDGFRLSPSITRSGPNQYLNTVDPMTLARIEVLRGSGSVLYGSDAIGGVVSLHTNVPTPSQVAARGRVRSASADRSLAGRAELDADFGPVRLLGGLGGASFGDLRSAGPLAGATEPQYDGKRQQFTGYDQLAGDVKMAAPLVGGLLTGAYSAYRQLDAPRTDKCTSPPLACRLWSEQYFDLAYVRFEGDYRRVEEVRVGLALTRTHERRTAIREDRDQSSDELDDVGGLQLTGRASVPTLRLAGQASLRISYGGDAYVDEIASEAEVREISTERVQAQARGKYLDGSRYMSAGGFVFAELLAGPRLGFTTGLRLASFRAKIAADPESLAPAFSQTWVLPVASAGARVALSPMVSLVANLDQGFRAPNLDDLSARSSEGPGFQLGNSALDPETSLTAELGAKLEHPGVRGQAFAYATRIVDFIGREGTTCPVELDAQCGDTANVYRLVNRDAARIVGVELAAETDARMGPWLGTVFGNLTWTRGSTEPGMGESVPLSKIPPLAGRIGARARMERVMAELVGTFARAQDRLSPDDQTDSRIPAGGTPGYFTVDVRVGARVGDSLHATLTLQNLTNEAYRVHGSGVDGAGFGVIGSISGTLAP